MINPFPSYQSLPAPADDDLWAKWKAIQDNLDINSDNTVLAIEELTLSDIGDLNRFLNQEIKYVAEPSGINIWKIPAQTWQDRTGDCKDYATLKYALLKKAGIEQLMIVVGEIKSLEIKNPQHAFLLAWIEGAWRVLDNRFDHLIEPKDYDNFIPIKGITGNDIILFSKTFIIGEKNAVQS